MDVFDYLRRLIRSRDSGADAPSDPLTADDRAAQQRHTNSDAASSAGEGVAPAPRGSRTQRSGSSNGRDAALRSDGSRRRKASEDLLVIGLDFGTSSSKCVVRRLRDKEGVVTAAGGVSTDLPWFATPTAAHVGDGAVRLGDGTRGLSNLKVEAMERWSEPIRIEGSDRLLLAYLAWRITDALAEAERHFNLEFPRWAVNLGVPIAFFDQSEKSKGMQERFLCAGRLAVALAKTQEWKDGLSTDQAGGARIAEPKLASALCRASGMLEDVEGVRTMPESVAALVSMQHNPAMGDGSYSIVDLGGSTCDVSTAMIRTVAGNKAIEIYSDSCEQPGMFELERKKDAAAAEEVEALLDGWWRQWKRTWGMGFDKDRRNRHAAREWKKSVLLLAGGGSLDEGVRTRFRRGLEHESPVAQVFPSGPPVRAQTYDIPNQVLRMSSSPAPKCRERFLMLAVAHGLSFHHREWPKWYAPATVKAQPGPALHDGPSDPVDAGYSGR